MKFNGQDFNLAHTRKIPLLSAGLVGATLGTATSWIVNSTLIEVSLNSFFSVYFGVLFTLVGVFMLWRIATQYAAGDRETKQFEMIFGGAVCASGMVCFLLKRQWCVGLTPLMKVPLYTLLGTSVAFSVTFSIVDLLNWFIGFLSVAIHSKNIVQSKTQIHLILCCTLLMGGLFGFIFGCMDVEDAALYEIRISLMREERYCWPLGFVLGCIAGAGNEYVRQAEEGYNYLDSFDADI